MKRDFLWGAALSNVQAEGAYLEDGKGLNVYDTLVVTPEKGIVPMFCDTAVAADHYHHYKEDIDFEEAAANMGISYSYMRRVMKEDGDISIVDYVNRLRIKEAKRLLQTTELKTQEIAEQVGYHNVQSLNRFFKKYEGTTPNAVRSLDKK